MFVHILQSFNRRPLHLEFHHIVHVSLTIHERILVPFVFLWACLLGAHQALHLTLANGQRVLILVPFAWAHAVLLLSLNAQVLRPLEVIHHLLPDQILSFLIRAKRFRLRLIHPHLLFVHLPLAVVMMICHPATLLLKHRSDSRYSHTIWLLIRDINRMRALPLFEEVDLCFPCEI